MKGISACTLGDINEDTGEYMASKLVCVFKAIIFTIYESMQVQFGVHHARNAG
jgi:hypothetical protein